MKISVHLSNAFSTMGRFNALILDKMIEAKNKQNAITYRYTKSLFFSAIFEPANESLPGKEINRINNSRSSNK